MKNTADLRELTEAWATSSFTPWEPRLNRQNIWPLYKSIREKAWAVRSDAHDDLWVIGRYEDVRRAALDYATFSSASGVVVGSNHPLDPPGTPIDYDPPLHAKYRSVMAAPFLAKRIQQFEGLVRREATRILDEIGSTEVFDIVGDIAEPLSVSVVSEIIGFDQTAKDQNRKLSLDLIYASVDQVPAARSSYKEFIQGQVAASLAQPGDGLMGDLVRQSQDATLYTRDELHSMIHALALAGHHTTINGIASMLYWAADPTIRARWLNDPSDSDALKAFVEESLRIDPPIHIEARRVTTPVEQDGVSIPKGAQVALLFASANHDERVFDVPETFDASRAAQHLSFGHGVHTCLGMALSRLEMFVILSEMMRRYPRYTVNGEPVDSGMVFGHHMGWDSIPARLGLS